MNRRGVTYDTGIVFSGPGYNIPTRPRLDLATAERELQIARDDLHCNAVRLIGREVDRLVQVAERALALGLEVWLSPALWAGLLMRRSTTTFRRPSGPRSCASSTPTVSSLSSAAS